MRPSAARGSEKANRVGEYQEDKGAGVNCTGSAVSPRIHANCRSCGSAGGRTSVSAASTEAPSCSFLATVGTVTSASWALSVLACAACALSCSDSKRTATS
jgi:hypothetical protein